MVRPKPICPPEEWENLEELILNLMTEVKSLFWNNIKFKNQIDE